MLLGASICDGGSYLHILFENVGVSFTAVLNTLS